MLNYDGRLDEEKVDIVMKEYSLELVSKEFIEAVEHECGMDCTAWDTIDPREIVAAVLKVSHKYVKGV